MPERVICEICGRVIPPHAHYVVKIEVFADPSVPAMSAEELEETDFDQKLAEVMEEMKGLSAEDLMDQVHRKFEFRICRICQLKFLANPLGKPRQSKMGRN